MAGVELLYGPMLLGVVLNAILYGIICKEMVNYYQRYTHDFVWTRYLILYLFIVETAVVVVEVGIIYQPLVLEYGTAAAIAFFPKLLPGDPILISIVSAPIQMFAAWRIKVITRSYILPTLILLLALVSFGGGMLMFTLLLFNSRFADFGKFKYEAIMWLVSSAACDILIAVGMTYTLLTRKTGFSAVDGQINRIVSLSIETGSVTAAAALTNILLASLFENQGVNFIIDFVLSSLYTLSILAMLNSREPKRANDLELGGVSSPAQTPTLASTHRQYKSQPYADAAGPLPKARMNLEVYKSIEVLQADPHESTALKPYVYPPPQQQKQAHQVNVSSEALVQPNFTPGPHHDPMHGDSDDSFALPLQPPPPHLVSTPPHRRIDSRSQTGPLLQHSPQSSTSSISRSTFSPAGSESTPTSAHNHSPAFQGNLPRPRLSSTPTRTTFRAPAPTPAQLEMRQAARSTTRPRDDGAPAATARF